MAQATRWRFRECGAEIRGAALSPERSTNQINPTRHSGHRVALDPWPKGRANAYDTSGSGWVVYTREPGRWRQRWDSLALSTRVLVTVGEIRDPLSYCPEDSTK